MKIEELKDKSKVDELTVEVSKVLDTEQTASGSSVQKALVQDETGQVLLKLWNEQINSLTEGDRVTVKNGYSRLFNGEMEVTSGKFGSLKKVN